MSWWGGGGKESDSSSGGSDPFASSSKDFTDTASLPSSFDSGSGGGVPLSAGVGGAAELQQFSVALQQQMLVQQVITELTDTAFLKCVSSTRDSQLSSSEKTCVKSAVNKWMDTNEFMVGRVARKSEKAAGSSFG